MQIIYREEDEYGFALLARLDLGKYYVRVHIDGLDVYRGICLGWDDAEHVYASVLNYWFRPGQGKSFAETVEIGF